MNQLEKFLIKGFIGSVFFIHYELILLPITLHSIFLLFGLLFMFLKRIELSSLKQTVVSYEIIAVVCLGMVMIFGYVFNFRTATLSNLQAYILGLLCFAYVKDYSYHVSYEWFFNVTRIFLLTNSVLIIIQFITGSFYPAKYLAAGNPTLNLPSGWADGATKNGMLTVFALSIIVGLISFRKSKFAFVDVFIMLTAIPALFLTASRTALGAFVLIFILNLIFILVSNKRKTSINWSGIGFLAILFMVLMLIAQHFGVLDIIEFYSNDDIDNSSSKVILHKLSNWQDDSLGERIENNVLVKQLLIDNALGFLTFGIGIGSFEVLEGINIHNSYLEILIQTGLFGSILFFYLVFSILIKVFKSSNRSVVFPILLGLLSIMIFMGFHDILRGRIFWLPLGMLAFYSRFKENII